MENAGDPFVFVSRSHDSDTLAQRLASDGAGRPRRLGRLRADGRYARSSTRSPASGWPATETRSNGAPSSNYADRYQPTPSRAEQDAFTAWLEPTRREGRRGDRRRAAAHRPRRAAARSPTPLVILAGHTHATDIQRRGLVTVINGGSIGGGGTGNLADEQPTAVSLARLIYDDTDGFTPLAADLVSIDPGTGAAHDAPRTARRVAPHGLPTPR